LSRRLLAGLGLVVAVVLVLHVLPIGGGDRVWGELLDVAHVLGFAVLAFAAARFCLSSRTRLNVPQSVLAAGVFSILVAVLSELAQIPTGRDANLGDLFRDSAGIVAGVSAATAVLVPARWRIGPAAVALAALATGLGEPSAPLLARVAAQARFPVLMDFDSALDTPLIQRMSAKVELVPAPPGWPKPGKVARIEPRGNWRYEGISFFGLPGDWSGYGEVEFLLAAEDDVRLNLTVRVHDRDHDNQYADRFNRTFDVGREPVRVSIPLAEIRDAPSTRKLDLRNIQDFTVFATAPYESAFYLDELHLK
jgi:hypothetical protein